MFLFDLLIFAGIVGGIVGLIKVVNRSPSGKASRRERSSWLVRAWNASGAPTVETTRLSEATADLTGRGIGATVRSGKKATVWAGHKTVVPAVGKAKQAGTSLAEKAERRWNARPDTNDRPPLLARRDPHGPGRREKPKRPSRVRALLNRFKARRTRSATPEPAVETASSVTPERQLHRWVEEESYRKVLFGEDSTPHHAAPSTKGETVTTPNTPAQGAEQTGNGTAMEVPPPPPDWATLIGRIGYFEPQSDADLQRFMIGEMAGVIAYAEALKTVHETCVNSIGLDPTAVQGVADYATAASDAGSAMASAHRRFRAVYEEIQRMVARGVVMPFKGRFFTGNAG